MSLWQALEPFVFPVCFQVMSDLILVTTGIRSDDLYQLSQCMDIVFPVKPGKGEVVQVFLDDTV